MAARKYGRYGSNAESPAPDTPKLTATTGPAQQRAEPAAAKTPPTPGNVAFIESLTVSSDYYAVVVGMTAASGAVIADGGSVWESNPPTRGLAGRAGFEDQ